MAASLTNAPPPASAPSRLERCIVFLKLADCDLSLPGRVALVGSVVIIGVGLHKGINLLVLLGYVVPVVLLVNAWSTRRLAQLVAIRRLPTAIFAGAPAEVEVQLSGDPAALAAATVVEDGGPSHQLRWTPSLDGGSTEATLRGKICLPQRGRYAWGPLVVRSAAPFGLVERSCPLAPGEEVLVLPRLGTLDRGRLLRRLCGHGEPDLERSRAHTRRSATAQCDFHGLRPFRIGDSPRAVHWRTSARRGELMVREYEDFTADSLILLLDTAAPATEPAFEAAVSLTATLCWDWCRWRSGRLAVGIGGAAPVVLEGVASLDLGCRVLAALATCAPGPSSEAALVARLSEAKLPRGSVVVVAAGPTALVQHVERGLWRSATLLTPAAVSDCYVPPDSAANAPAADPVAADRDAAS